ncbi:MAG: hypothetical protein A2X66_09710 [Ignavibacteria bacterium GWA2_54_16]|nr:MAG: hypothetical protein A2X66_09710 [Ignavibacteria bacterium GWA2_54_16]
MNLKTTMLIADDHPIFREGVANILSKEKNIEVVGQTGDGLEALRLIRELKPDVAIVDIAMPGCDGLELARKAQVEKLETQLIILTMYTDEGYFNQAIDVGVRGYLLKECIATDLVGAVRTVACGRYYFSPSISDALVRRKGGIESLLKKVPALDLLTPREKKILKLIAANKTSNEIAQELFVSRRTVQNHRNNICKKLGFRGHHRLLQFAIENKSYL